MPLKGVVVFGQPAAAASVGESNHSPRWKVWMGRVIAGFLVPARASAGCTGVGTKACPGATIKVSLLNRPTKSPTPLPALLVSISPWYQDRPNAALGTWMRNRSYSVFGFSPKTSTWRFSNGPTLLAESRPHAFG